MHDMKRFGNQGIAYVMLLASLFAALPHIFRWNSGNTAIPGITSYEHLEGVLSNMVNPYYLLIRVFPSEKAAATFIPIIISLCSVALFMAVMHKLGFNKKMVMTGAALMALSPIFTYMSFILTPISLSLLFILAAALLLAYDNRISLMLAALAVLLNALIGTTAAFVCLIIMLTYYLTFRRRGHIVLFSAIAMIISFFMEESIKLHPETSASYLISDFGALVGFGAFEFMLLVIGIFLCWKHKGKLAFIYISFMLLLAFSIFINQELKIFILPASSVFISVLFLRIYERKWKIQMLKTLSLIILISGILFSTISNIDRISGTRPDDSMVESLEWLGDHADKDHKIFSAPDNAPWVRHIAEREPVMMSDEETELTYYSRNLKTTSAIFDSKELAYIWIDSEMMKDLTARENPGLLFLFTNNETFKRVFFNEDTEIWRFYSNKNRIGERR